MNETRTTDIDVGKYKDILFNYIKLIYLYLISNSVGLLEHVLLVTLVYVCLCVAFYMIIFKQYCHKFRLVNSERFPRCQRALVVTAHPDDECMFFGPTIFSLSQRQDCTVFLLCLSIGDYEQKGNLRKLELWNACKMLNIKSENITLVNATQLQDHPNNNWRVDLTAKFILNAIETLDIEFVITFDRDGVSNHANHSAIYYATASLYLAGLIPNDCKIFMLESVNICRKYVSIFDLVISLMISNNWFILNWTNWKIVFKAMKLHGSQMLWFRKLYILFSRFLFINTLREMNMSDIELEIQLNDT